MNIFNLRNTFVFIAILTTIIFSGQALSHAKQENYIWVNVDSDGINGRFEVNINDVKKKLNIDIDAAGEDRLAGVVATASEVQRYLKANFEMSDSNGVIEYEFTTISLHESGPDFIQYGYTTNTVPSDNILTIKNSIWLTKPYISNDRMHRSLVVVEHNEVVDQEFGKGNVALVFSPNKTVQEIDLKNPGSILEWKEFLWQGMVHIGIGLDHILFIVVLLLSVVVVYKNGQWEPVLSFKKAFLNTLKIVTIFTIAHSITLSLAALELVNLPVSFVETVIAASIAAVAINNIFPKYSAHSWILIFVFGLFHGLGFASVMGDLQFRHGLIERILLMFNVGVEIGQLLIVAVVFPILFWLRNKSFYKTIVVNALSVLAIIVSFYWMAERTGILSTT